MHVSWEFSLCSTLNSTETLFHICKTCSKKAVFAFSRLLSLQAKTQNVVVVHYHCHCSPFLAKININKHFEPVRY